MGLCFDNITIKWEKVGELKSKGQAAFGLYAGTGLAYGDYGILIFGGDYGTNSNQAERLIDAVANAGSADEREKYHEQKVVNLTSHPRFCKELYLFDTLIDGLDLAGEIGGDTEVTTTTF